MSFDGITDPAWTDLTAAAPYTTNSTVRVLVDAAGNIHLTGDVNRNAAASGAVLCTLDVGLRPAALTYRLLLTGPVATSTGYLSIATNGDVSLWERTGAVTRYYLNSAAPFTAL